MNLFYDLPVEMQITINKIRFSEVIKHFEKYDQENCISLYEHFHHFCVEDMALKGETYNENQRIIVKEIIRYSNTSNVCKNWY